MPNPETVETRARRPIRLWPGVIAAMLLLLVRFGLPLVVPDGGILGVLGAALLGIVILLWWLLFSRAPWIERVGAIAFMALALAATRPIVHESISGGLMGRMLFLFMGIPFLPLALVAGVAATRRFGAAARRAAIAAAILLACGAFTLVRTDGITGSADAQMAWRWTPTHEERLLATARDNPVAPASEPAPVAAAPATPTAPEPEPEGKDAPAKPIPDPAGSAKAAPEPATSPVKAAWPGFRGPDRDAVIHGVRLEIDWSKSPPVEMWRRPIGPGWSSFAVSGDLVYTQEQRGEEELVSCYRLSTGAPVWRHSDPARFYESNGGPGPRGTPTVHAGRVYSFGATGIVNALDARTGTVVWSRNAAADTGAPMPGWGFASSPLLVGDVAVVAASGRLVAYDAATGEPRWVRRTLGGGYSSPHLVTIDGVAQIVLQTGGGATSVAPADGTVLWEHAWETGVAIVQPAVASEADVLIAGGDSMGGTGLRRVGIAHRPAGWSADERWTSRGLKPYFNDFIVHEGHAFGFDGSILACIDLADGTRKWKGGRYGHGQMILLPDQDLLLIVSEEGELALVSATPDRHTEMARFKAIEGKTWNHPVLVGDVVLIRNGEEMAAFRLPLAGR